MTVPANVHTKIHSSTLEGYAVTRDCADVDFDRWWVFGSGDSRHRPAEHVVIGKLERFEGDVWILVLQKLLPKRRELVFRQESISAHS